MNGLLLKLNPVNIVDAMHSTLIHGPYSPYVFAKVQTKILDTNMGI